VEMISSLAQFTLRTVHFLHKNPVMLEVSCICTQCQQTNEKSQEPYDTVDQGQSVVYVLKDLRKHNTLSFLVTELDS